MQPHLVVGPPSQAERQICTPAKDLRHLTELHGTDIVGEIRHENADQAFGIEGKIIDMKDAVVFAAPAFADGNQAGEPGVRGLVGRVDKH